MKIVLADDRGFCYNETKKGVSLMNERLTWDKIVEEYPESWVALTDAQMDGHIIITAVVSAVCKTNKERSESERRLMSENKIFTWRKTTEAEGAYVL